MRNLLFILTALISGVVSAQHINGVKTLTINKSFLGIEQVGELNPSFRPVGTIYNSVIIGIAQNDYVPYSYVADGGLFQPTYTASVVLEAGKMYRFTVREGIIVTAELLSGPVKEDGKLYTNTSTKTLAELTIEPALIDEFIEVLKEAQSFTDTTGGFERLFDGHLRVATNGDSPMVTIFDTLDGTLISVPKNRVVYRMFYLFKS